jgi:hypothetical protein
VLFWPGYNYPALIEHHFAVWFFVVLRQLALQQGLLVKLYFFRSGIRFITAVLFLALITGCAPQVISPAATETAQPTTAPLENAITAQTPTAAATATAAPTLASTTTEPPASPVLSLWVSPDLPARFRQALELPPAVQLASQQNTATLRLDIATAAPEGPALDGYWVYALVAPFPTVTDQISPQSLKAAWQGLPLEVAGGGPLLMDADTLRAFSGWWGSPAPQAVRVIEAELLLETAWKEAPALAVVPFEAIQPRWKVLRLGEQSPLDRDFSPETYPLALPIRLSGAQEAMSALPTIDLPTNRDPRKLTVLVMTGVTALTRNIALEMENKGILYPLQDIRPWLEEADLTHISNEVSFHAGCPAPAPGRGNKRFCSSPKYIELLEAAGADIIELTGNHNMDWGPGPFLETLEMYRQRGWQYYGGGTNLVESQQPLLVEHNGTRLAFLGCSRAGPSHVWATASSPGSAPCDFAEMEKQIQQLRSKGYLPVVTIQAFEGEWYVPEISQGVPDFRRMARAGAVIVSGSQAHNPQTMTFVGDHFVHYGLGNLFFDQMSPLPARQGFIDRHIFYNGAYLGVELLTTLVEELGRPRPMTAVEREKLLKTIFDLSTWQE